MQTSPLPNTTLAEFYRFALLLTGNIRAAEQVMAETLAEVALHVAQVRSETGRQAWFIQRILPEPERSALALFYLDFFTIAEIAELLKMNVETLAETLAAARGLLEQSLRTTAPDDSTT